MDYDQIISETEKALMDAIKKPEMKVKVTDMIKRISVVLGIEPKVETDTQIDSMMSELQAIVFENLKARVISDTSRRQGNKVVSQVKT